MLQGEPVTTRHSTGVLLEGNQVEGVKTIYTYRDLQTTGWIMGVIKRFLDNTADYCPMQPFRAAHQQHSLGNKTQFPRVRQWRDNTN